MVVVVNRVVVVVLQWWCGVELSAGGISGGGGGEDEAGKSAVGLHVPGGEVVGHGAGPAGPALLPRPDLRLLQREARCPHGESCDVLSSVLLTFSRGGTASEVLTPTVLFQVEGGLSRAGPRDVEALHLFQVEGGLTRAGPRDVGALHLSQVEGGLTKAGPRDVRALHLS